MIASHKPPPNGYTHTLSETFLTAIEQAMRMIRSKEPGWKSIVMDMLLQEFPNNSEMRTFAEDSFSEIVGLLLKGERAIYIHRSLSHGLELFVDD